MSTATPYDERYRDPATIDADLDAVSHELDLFELALRRRDRHEMSIARARIASKLESLEQEWRQ